MGLTRFPQSNLCVTQCHSNEQMKNVIKKIKCFGGKIHDKNNVFQTIQRHRRPFEASVKSTDITVKNEYSNIIIRFA